MMRVRALLVALARIVAGYVAASLAGAFVLVLMTMIAMAAKSDPELPTIIAGSIFAAMFFALFVGFIALVPAMIAIAVAEAVPIRAWWYFTLAGLADAGVFVIAALRDDGPPAESGAVAIILLAGAASGFAYWLIAGRWSGDWRAVTSPE